MRGVDALSVEVSDLDSLTVDIVHNMNLPRGVDPFVSLVCTTANASFPSVQFTSPNMITLLSGDNRGVYRVLIQRPRS
jgi:hypothetical protein